MCCGESLAQGDTGAYLRVQTTDVNSAPSAVTRRVASHAAKSCSTPVYSPLLRGSEAVRPTLLLHHYVDHVACVELSSGDHRLTDFLHPPFTFPALLTPLGGGRANTKHHHPRHRSSSPSSMSSCQATETVGAQARASLAGVRQSSRAALGATQWRQGEAVQSGST